MKLTKEQIALCNNETLSTLFNKEKYDYPEYDSASEAIKGILIKTIAKAKEVGATRAIIHLETIQEEKRFKGSFLYEFRSIVLETPSLIGISKKII